MKSAKMVSILQIDGLGKRYGLLPSEVIRRGDTFDLYIMDAAMSFEHYHNYKAANNGRAPVPEYTEEELMTLLNKARQ
jgi:hypothetical protein